MSRTLLSCAVILLLLALASTEPALAQQTFSIDFPMKAGLPNSCMTHEPAASGGALVRCQIVLPDNVPSNLFIRGVFFECQPSSSRTCMNTQECPGRGTICDRQVNAVVPVDFNISQPGVRAVEWWGWTSDPGDAILHFDISLGP
jgi:hypothetical protein